MKPHVSFVILAKCSHLVKDVSFNDRQELGMELDETGVGLGIENLMGVLLESEDALIIWRSCQGGNDPAMGLLYHLGCSELATLAELEGYAKSAETKKISCKALLEVIESYKENHGKTRLDQLPYKVLWELANEMSVKQHPQKVNVQFTWKNIASAAGLKTAVINNPDAPASNARQNESMTMNFFERVSASYRQKCIAWLAEGLAEIGQGNLLNDMGMFEKCIKNGCIILQGQGTNTQMALAEGD